MKFVGRAELGIAVVGQVDKAAFGAQSAARTNIEPGSYAGSVVGT